MNQLTEPTRYPLMVIAVFAGLAELAGALALPHVAEPNQMLCTLFLVGFPILLAIGFFLTLNLNPQLLQRPAGLAAESHYLELFRPASTAEKLRKLDAGLTEQPLPPAPLAEESSPQDGHLTAAGRAASKDRLLSLVRRDARCRLMLAQGLTVDRLAREFNALPLRDVALRERYGNQAFAAAFEDGQGLVLVEIEFFSRVTHSMRMRDTLLQLEAAFRALPRDARSHARFILAVCHEMPADHAARIEAKLGSLLGEVKIPCEVRMYHLQQLIDQILRNGLQEVTPDERLPAAPATPQRRSLQLAASGGEMAGPGLN